MRLTGEEESHRARDGESKRPREREKRETGIERDRCIYRERERET